MGSGKTGLGPHGRFVGLLALLQGAAHLSAEQQQIYPPPGQRQPAGRAMAVGLTMPSAGANTTGRAVVHPWSAAPMPSVPAPPWLSTEAALPSPPSACQLAIVISFIAHDVPHLVSNFGLWDYFMPCRAAARGETAEVGKVDVVLYSNQALNRSDRAALETAATSMASWGSCFRHLQFVSLNLSGENDHYHRGSNNIKADGPNMAFFSLFSNAEILALRPDYVLWMEHDMVPIRPLWLEDGLLAEINGRCDLGEDRDFWTKGSVHRGLWLDFFSKWNTQQRLFTNGCQLYRYGDPSFEDMLVRIISKWPLKVMQTFDTTFLTYVLNAKPSEKAFVQQVAHKFETTAAIFYYGIKAQYMNNGMLPNALPTIARHAYLYHGPRSILDPMNGLPRWEQDADPTLARAHDKERDTVGEPRKREVLAQLAMLGVAG